MKLAILWTKNKAVKVLRLELSTIVVSKPFPLIIIVLSTGNAAQACPLSIDVGCEVSDALDGNLGDDDGDTWSQSDEEPYQGDT